MSTVPRRTKWCPTPPTPPPPPSPKILHLTDRRRTHRRKQTKPQNNPPLLINQSYALSHKGSLETQFYQENNEWHELLPELLNSSMERRERVEEEEEEWSGGLAEDKWRFQAEMLRAECNLLRTERELTLKKLEKNRVKMETTLRSAVQTLQSGRKKMEEGKNGNAVLEEEMEDLAEKIEELQNSAVLKEESQVGKYSNFEKKAWVSQRRLQKHGLLLSNENEYADSCSPISMNNSDVIKESDTDEAMPKEGKCGGHCKAIVQRIVEQVRAETEQWSQMQKMLEMVRAEMEDLQVSRDYWEREAHYSDHEARSLMLAVEAWKERALDYEKQVRELELKLCLVKQKKTQEDKRDVVADSLPLGAQLLKLKKNYHVEENKSLSLAKQLAKEKISSNRRDKELSEDGDSKAAKRLPLREIVNSSRENHGIAFHYNSPESSRIRESFRK